MSSSKKKDLKFGEAMAELEEILRRIEGEEVDIDELAVKVKRSAELIRICRSRIEAATIQVEAIGDHTALTDRDRRVLHQRLVE